MKRTFLPFLTPLKFHCPALEDTAAVLFPSVFPKDSSGHSSPPTLLHQQSYSQNFLRTDGLLTPNMDFSLPLWMKGLVRPGFGCKSTTVGFQVRRRWWKSQVLIKGNDDCYFQPSWAGFSRFHQGAQNACQGWSDPIRLPLEILQFLAT